jgi:hypothetical protein
MSMGGHVAGVFGCLNHRRQKCKMVMKAIFLVGDKDQYIEFWAKFPG